MPSASNSEYEFKRFVLGILTLSKEILALSMPLRPIFLPISWIVTPSQVLRSRSRIGTRKTWRPSSVSPLIRRAKTQLKQFQKTIVNNENFHSFKCKSFIETLTIMSMKSTVSNPVFLRGSWGSVNDKLISGCIIGGRGFHFDSIVPIGQLSETETAHFRKCIDIR